MILNPLSVGAEAILITSGVNRFYYTGFNSSAGSLFITFEKSYFLTDSRYIQAASESVEGINVLGYKRYFETLGELIDRHNIKKIAVEGDFMTVRNLKKYSKTFPQCSFLAEGELDTFICEQRAIKRDEEIKKIKKAQKITGEAYFHILNFIKTGVSEQDLALEIELFMRKNGAQNTAFDLIVVSGENSALPHGVPGGRTLKPGDFITMDTGAVVDGYRCDMTRTVALGEVSEEQKNVYDIVLNAQCAALEKIRRGVTCGEIDAAARNIIKSAGYGEFFGHGTGHGVGLEVHEYPLVSPGNSCILSSGMIVTVEPGIYIPGKFGVRIEDMAKVTDYGYENLSKVPKSLTIL